MRKIVNGYIIEAEKKGFFYHRTRAWIQYENPNQAFVWPPEEVEKIIESAKKLPDEWELKPAQLHSATWYAPVGGYTEINHPPFSVRDFGSPSIYKGSIYKGNNRFNLNATIVGVEVHL